MRIIKGGVFLMYEVIISGGPSDGHILGEFYSVADAADMIKAYNQSEHHPDEYLIIRRMEV